MPGGALEADAGKEYFNLVHFPKVGCGEVLVLGMGPKTEPAYGFILSREVATGPAAFQSDGHSEFLVSNRVRI
jgi:hypothetical protein